MLKKLAINWTQYWLTNKSCQPEIIKSAHSHSNH